MNAWIETKLREVAKGRCWCENPTCKGRGGGLEAHHAIFSRSKNHPEYDSVYNMVMLCHKCNTNRELDNRPGRVWAVLFLAKKHGKDKMREWLESLRETHKDHKDIDYFLRCLDD